MKNKKKIVVAPLNWGLGHATRCIPIIRALLAEGFEPLIASDGVALDLLKKEFPDLKHIHLPSYHIVYPKNGKYFLWKILSNGHKMIYAIFSEKRAIQKIVKEHQIDGVISDNRLGIFSSKVPSVFITHQLQVMTGIATHLSSWMHRQIIKKYRACWVPDLEGSVNLSGALGHLKKKLPNVEYIGPLSRLRKIDLPIRYDLMVILSGPEPQRTFLEEKLIAELQPFQGNILFVKGKIEAEQTTTVQPPFTFYNFMNTDQLATAFNESKEVLCRSGYTTVMDLAFLEKKAFFIPTPGQFEQVYLADLYAKMGIAPTCTQEEFTLGKLEHIKNYTGLPKIENETDWKKLFSVFD